MTEPPENNDYTPEEVERVQRAEAELERAAVADYRLRRMLALRIEVERRDARIAELEAGGEPRGGGE